MPPKKLQPQKKKLKTIEASSSRAPQPELLSNKEYAKLRRKKFQKLRILNIQYLDWTVLDHYGLVDLLPQTVKDATWFSLFSIREPAYKDITLEFLSTVSIDNDGPAPIMTFQAYGEVREIELKRIGYVLGLYDTPEASVDLPNSWPEDMNASKLWIQLTKQSTEPFASSKSLSTTFVATEHKLLHHILAHTLSCKKTSHSKVTGTDMFYLYSLISGYKIDLGVEVANFIDRQVTDPRTKVLLCGGYITALLKGMGIFIAPAGDDGILSKPISDAPFRIWGLSKGAIQASDDSDNEIETPEMTPADRPSTSQNAPPMSPYDQLRQEIKELKAENKKERAKNRKERKKHKKFRTTLFKLLKSAFSCSTSTDMSEFQYQTSSGEDSDTDTDS